MKKAGLIILILIALVLIIALYFTFFFSYKCSDASCFISHQEKCTKTKFVNNAEDVKWLYYIKGKEDGKCEIEVSVLEVKQGAIDKKILEEKSMTCLLPLGSIASPEADLLKCHGVLKEEMQNLIIQKLHSYIIESVGEITEELRKAV